MKYRSLLAFTAALGAVSFLLYLGWQRTASADRVEIHDNDRSQAALDVARPSLEARIRKLPLSFEMDRSGGFDFVSRNVGRALYLAADRAVIAFPTTVDRKRDKAEPGTESLQIELLGSNIDAEACGIDQVAAKSNYLFGSDPQKWVTAANHYSKAQFSDIYPGIDIVYYGDQDKLEYDLIVKPGAAPDQIRFKFDGANSLQIDGDGDLVARLDSKEVRQRAPVVYQEMNGTRTAVDGEFVLHSGHEVGFRVGEYDPTKDLVIDPVVVYSTYLGGSGGNLFDQESGNSIAVDSSGNVYLAGVTPSINFPTRDPFQANAGGSGDCFVSKLNRDGSDLIFSTFLGGSGPDQCRGMTLDAAGNIYVAGLTESVNFPVSAPYQGSNAGSSDGFVSKLDPTGSSLVFSTYLGGLGPDFIEDVRVDQSGNVLVGGTTSSVNFPTMNAVQPGNAGDYDCFLAKFNPTASSLVYSTYYGGQLSDFGQGFTADSSGNAYITGVTNSRNFPVTPGVLQSIKSGSDDAFVTKLNPSGAVAYSTYFGGNGVDNASAIAVDSRGNAIITGFTRSLNLPRRNAVQTQLLGGVDSFVSKLNLDGRSLVFSTFLGGSILESGFGLGVDGIDNVYATGRTNSGDFPLKKELHDFFGLDDIYVTKFSPEGALLFSTPLGGDNNDLGTAIAADNAGNVFVTGTADFGLLTTPGAFQPNLNGGTDAFVAKINTVSGAARSDFDGDKITDIAVFRPSDGTWYILNSSNNMFRAEQFGTSGDRPVPGDYDGDGRTDIAVYRPSDSMWYWRRSSDHEFRNISWGSSGDKPVQGDYDADGKTDVAVFRPSIGFWLILRSSDASLRAQQFGGPDDKPVQADYDGDEQTDLALYKPSTGVWSILRSFTGFKNQQFGISSDLLAPADYDADGKDDIGVFRPQGGVWYLDLSRSSSAVAEQFGAAGDVPAPGDYDGDRKIDLAVYRGGIWYIRQSSSNAYRVVQWGLAGDIPISSAYQPQ